MYRRRRRLRCLSIRGNGASQRPIGYGMVGSVEWFGASNGCFD